MKMQKISLVFLVVGALTSVCSFALAENSLDSVRVDIRMSSQERESLTKPVKTEIPVTEFKVFEQSRNTLDAFVKTSSHGQSSIIYPRKNFKIDSLKDRNGDTTDLKVASVKGKKLILTAGSGDPLVTKNMILYRLYRQIGIPMMPSAYLELSLNGISQGLYMVTPNPDEYIINTLNADIAFRRVYTDAFDFRQAKKSLSEVDKAAYTKQLQSIFTDLKKLKGAELLQTLEKKMNLDRYMRLLAVNYLIHNADYYDEIYFYGSKTSSGEMYFDVYPWDFDDSFGEKMHLTVLPFYPNNGRSKRSQNQLMFSFESLMDQTISQDPYLMNKYFEVFGRVISELTPQKIDQVFASVEAQLAPYLNNSDVLNAGLIDQGKTVYTAQGIIETLQARRDALIQAIPQIREELVQISQEPKSRAKRMGKIRLIVGHLEQALIRRFTGR